MPNWIDNYFFNKVSDFLLSIIFVIIVFWSIFIFRKEKKSKIGDEKLKLCLSCKQEKKVSEFSKNPNAPDSLRIFCKNCHKAQKRKQRRQARKFNA